MNNNILSKLKIGVLALQGDYELHEAQLDTLRIKHCRVKLPHEMDDIDALIIPGGESTTMNVLIDRFNLRSALIQFGKKKPIYGTCAGMILLSREIVDNQAEVKPLGLIDISVVRNGYGRQIHSFEQKIAVTFPEIGNQERSFTVETAFIRAPKVISYDNKVQVLAEFDNSPVLVMQDNILAASFHAEVGDQLTLLSGFFEYFLCQTADKYHILDG